MNFIEKFVLKRIAKKIIKNLPDIKEKIENEGIKIFEKYEQIIKDNAKELLAKIEIAVIQFIEKYENKSE